jgi:DNA polymerase-1
MVAYDHGRETFRSEIWPAYKTNRKPTPPEYTALVPLLKQCFAERGITPLSLPGFEADDIIGTICQQYDTYLRVILTRDKDFMQLVRDNRVCLCHDGNFVYEAQVLAKFGVPPEMVTDVLGLMGDHTDNIPGVAGIGEKTASKLIAEFGHLEDLYADLPHVKPDRIRMLLKTGKEAAFLSRQLATIKTDVEGL